MVEEFTKTARGRLGPSQRLEVERQLILNCDFLVVLDCREEVFAVLCLNQEVLGIHVMAFVNTVGG